MNLAVINYCKMDHNLLKRLLPGEVIEYSTRQGARATDGRDLLQHRGYSVTRAVMSNAVSCSVYLGQTHVLCQVKPINEEDSYTVNKN
jgi:exosome complex RNA-binding protein Rrp42 (RNase PH superfamily)